MDAGILSAILLEFRGASEHWATGLIGLLEPSWFPLAKLAFLLLILGLLFGSDRYFGAMLMGLLWLGATHVAFLYGWEMADTFSHGVRRVATHLGVGAYDPSGIVELGAYVAQPLMTSASKQGAMSWGWNFSSIFFYMAGILVFLAFCILALVQFSLLLVNYLLIGAAPFFLLWLCVPLLNGISHRWISLFCGVMAGLFVVGLIAGVMEDLGQSMGDRYQRVFAEATTTLTWVDWGEPLAVAFVLAASFAWIPIRFSREAMGIAGGLMSGGGMFFGFASSAVTMPARAAGGGGSQGSSMSGGSGGQGQIGNSSSSSSGSSGMGPAQQPTGSAWGSGAQPQTVGVKSK